MSNEATFAWMGGIGGFVVGAFLSGVIVLGSASVSECQRWERKCIARDLGTYDDNGKFQWKVKPEKQP